MCEHPLLSIIGFTVAALLENKMRSLRTEMAAKLRLMKKPSGSEGGKDKKPWRFLEALMFLKASIVPRGNVSNLSNEVPSISSEVMETLF